MVYFMGVENNKEILEIGTGKGIAVGPLVNLTSPKRVVGLDIEEKALDYAVQHYGDVATFVKGDARNMSTIFGKEFDLVIDFGTLFHVKNSELALIEISKVLRKGMALDVS